MPVDRRAALQLGMLLMVVPAQYLISQLMTNPESQRAFALKSLVNEAVGFKDKYLSLGSWKKWCVGIINSISPGDLPDFDDLDDPNGESPAVEVINYKDPNGYFGASTEPRTERPPEVKYRIGQVVRHKKWGYRGVIVGWDLQARAPEYWFKHNHPGDKKHWKSMPNFSILVDTRDRLSPQLTYVPQENIEVIINTQILHPSLDDHFEGFDGAQYLPRPWLKSLYPLDS